MDFPRARRLEAADRNAAALGTRQRFLLAALMVVALATNADCESSGKYFGGLGGGNCDSSTNDTTRLDAGNCVGVEQRLGANQGLVVEDFETPRHDDTDTCLQNDPNLPNPNLLGGDSACFNNCGNNCPDITAGKIETSLTQTPEDALWCSGRSLVLSYDVSDDIGGTPPRGGRFAGYVVSLAGDPPCPTSLGSSDAGVVTCGNGLAARCCGFNADGLNLKYLSFWAKFDLDSPNSDVEVAIKDNCLQQTTLKPRAVQGGYLVNTPGSWSKARIDLARLRQNGIDTSSIREISFTFAQVTGYAPSGRMYLDDIAFER